MKVYVDNRYDLLQLKGLMHILLKDYKDVEFVRLDDGFKILNTGTSFEVRIAQPIIKEVEIDPSVLREKLNMISSCVEELKEILEE